MGDGLIHVCVLLFVPSAKTVLKSVVADFHLFVANDGLGELTAAELESLFVKAVFDGPFQLGMDGCRCIHLIDGDVADIAVHPLAHVLQRVVAAADVRELVDDFGLLE